MSTTLRLLPRLLNFLNPSYIISRISSPEYPRGTGKTLRITKGRKRKVEEMMSLLQEAEEQGCDQVWAFRGKMRMVSSLIHPYRKYAELAVVPSKGSQAKLD